MAEVTSLAAARSHLERMHTRLANMRDDAKKAAKMGTQSAVVVAGGAAAGAIQAKFPTLPGTTVPTAAAVGAACVAAAMTGMLDDQSETVAMFGSGILAALTARETERMLRS